MKYFVIFLTLISFIFFTANNSVYGLSCENSNMTQYFAESNVVFAGQALSKEYVPSDLASSNGKSDAITQFSVIETFKGSSQETLSVISSEWFWGYNFTSNLKYVVFAYYDGQHLRHQTCTPTSLLEHADIEKIRQVANDLEPTVSDSTHTKLNVGKIQWLEASYSPSEVGVVRIVDPDMNLNPEKVDNFDIYVWSDSHTKGVTPVATETGVSTGVFESTVFLTLNYESGSRLKVAEGDTITAEYDDSTLPDSYIDVDVLRITAKSNIQATLDSPLKQFNSGISINEMQCSDNLVLVQKYDGSPACVTEPTKQKLIERGWADRIMNDFCFGEYLPVCGEDNVTYGNQCYLEREHVELKYLGECENFIPSDYNLDETEFLQIKNNMENVGYHICDVQLDENVILIKLNWIFEGSEPEKMILSNIPSNVKYEIKYLDGYADYFISKDSVYSCED